MWEETTLAVLPGSGSEQRVRGWRAAVTTGAVLAAPHRRAEPQNDTPRLTWPPPQCLPDISGADCLICTPLCSALLPPTLRDKVCGKFCKEAHADQETQLGSRGTLGLHLKFREESRRAVLP